MLLNQIRILSFYLIIVFFIAGCATKAVKNDSKCQKTAADNIGSFFQFSPSDTDIFIGALNCLEDSESVSDYSAAREQLKIIVEKYPRSKWKNNAQSLIYIIQNLTQLKANVAAENLKNSADRFKLIKEIEALKTDIQRLKDLEIQLEIREKKLK